MRKKNILIVVVQMMSGDTSNIPGLDAILRGEILRKDALINQLVGQNKELMVAKDRQEIELTAQRETIQVRLLEISSELISIFPSRNTELTLMFLTLLSLMLRPLC